MRKIISLLLSFTMIFILAACGQPASTEKQEEIQSVVQKTDEQSETSQNGAGVEMQEIKEQPDTEMGTNLFESVSIEEQKADQEQNDPDVRPAISGSVENRDEYDTIILGYSIWHGQAPRIISKFLESYDFSGKTIIPFCTSHSSGVGSSAANLHALCSETVEWADGKRFEGGASKESVENWIGEIGIE